MGNGAKSHCGPANNHMKHTSQLSHKQMEKLKYCMHLTSVSYWPRLSPPLLSCHCAWRASCGAREIPQTLKQRSEDV